MIDELAAQDAVKKLLAAMGIRAEYHTDFAKTPERVVKMLAEVWQGDGLQCTAEEITVAFDISKSTLWRWCHKTYGEDFETVFAAKRKLGFISLRRTQFKLAQKSAAMAIFLGKQYLGQSDKDDWQRRYDEKLLELKEKKSEQEDW